MMTLDNRHKLAAPYWARPGLRTVTAPDSGGGNDDDADDADDEEDDDDEEDEDDDPDAGKSEDELRAEVKAARLALEEAAKREVRRKKEAARLRKRNAAAKPADGDDKPDAEAIKAEAQAAADQRVARAEARSRLRSLGLDDAKVARALKLIDLSDVIVEDDDVDGIDDALDALREDVPELFVKPTRKRRSTSGDGDRAGKPAPKTEDASKLQAAALLGRK